MAIRDLCSFDALATADIPNRWAIPLSAPTISAGTGRGGTSSLRAGSMGSGVARYGLSNHATYGIACSFKMAALPTGPNRLLSLLDGSADQLRLNIDATGKLQLVRGISTAILATTASVVFFPNVLHHFQFMATIDPAVGAYEVRVDGAPVLSGTGANTRETTNSFANGYCLLSGSAAGAGTWDLDDLYVWDGSGSLNTGFPGDVRVMAVLPSGAGATTGWTPSTGANYAAVDDATPNTTDYVVGNTASVKDTYAFTDIVGSGTVRGAQVSVYATKLAEGAQRGVKAVCRNGGIETLSAETTLGVGYRYWITSPFELDPATSAAWANLSALNAAEWGIQVST